MSNVAVLLDKAKNGISAASDNALAESLSVSRQVVHKWRSGESHPSDDHIAQLARMARDDAGMWLVRIRAEKATGDAARAWSALARRLGAAAALTITPICAAALFHGVSTLARVVNSGALYIMSLSRRVTGRHGQHDPAQRQTHIFHGPGALPAL